MNYETFKDELVEEVKAALYERDIAAEISTTVVEKMNQTYDSYERGVEFEEIVERVTDEIEKHLPTMPMVDVEQLTNYEKMKERISMEVVGYERNAEMLSKVPHERMEDMAVIYRFELNLENESRSTILITHSLLEKMGVTYEQLREDAVKNAPELRPAVIKGMSEVILEMMGEEAIEEYGVEPFISEEMMYVASVLDKTAGAGVLAYETFFNQAAERLGGDFFILPSSIHELLLVPDDGTKSFHELQAMVKEVNATQVSPEERLTDSVYHYDCKNHVFELAEKFELRKHEKTTETIENKEKPKEKESILVDLNKKKEEIARNHAKNAVEKKDKVKGGEAL